MADQYQPMFAASTGKSSNTTGSYQSMFGFSTEQNPTSQQLAQTRAASALKATQLQAQQKAQANAAALKAYNNRSLLTKATDVGKGFAAGTVNEAKAGGRSLLDIGKGAVDSAMGNKAAVTNVNKAKAKDEGQFLQPLARPLVGAAETIVHPASAHSYTPANTKDQQTILGKVPIQNINAGVASTYDKTHNPLEAGLYGAGQVAQDALEVGGAKAGVLDDAAATVGKLKDTVKTAGGKDEVVNTALQTAKQNTLLDAARQKYGTDHVEENVAAIKQPKQLSSGKISPEAINAAKQRIQHPALPNKPTDTVVTQPKETAVRTATPKPVNRTVVSTPAAKVTVASPEAKSVNTPVPSNPFEVPKATAPVETPTPKTSGSALKSESRAVEKGLTDEFAGKAQYLSGSYKDEASKAVQLVKDDPQKALDIATGKVPGDNTIHEVAVSKALENKALQEGDTDTLLKLAQSSRHSDTSEAAQRLGAEGYDATPSSPVKAIASVQKARTDAFESKTGVTATKAVSSEAKAIKANVSKVSKSDLHSFVDSLKC